MTITINLNKKTDRLLQAEATRRGVSEAEVAGDLIRESLEGKESTVGCDIDFIRNIGSEIRASIPTSELSEVPTDLGRNLDHYLYGQRIL